MPCGCFGGGKKSKVTIGGGLKEPTPPPIGHSAPTTKNKERSDGDPSKTAKKNDVVAAQDGEECALLGFRTTGSRPSSSVVDSPNSNSHTHTPSTAPIAASATSSQNTSLSHSSPSGDRHVATCRAQLVEKRREFFRDFIPDDYKSSPYTLTSSSSTLPTASRAQKFGKVRYARPLSQPHSPDFEAPPPPPGPHLLRHTPVSPKIESDDSGFGNPEFLLELKNASEEISRRWAMSDDEDLASPSSLKMRPRPRSPPNLIDTDPFFQTESTFETNEQNLNFQVDFSTNHYEQDKFEKGFEEDNNACLNYECEDEITEAILSSRLTPSPEVIENLSLEERTYPLQSQPSLPQTMITPPSPPVNVKSPLFASSTSQPLRAEPCDASSDEDNDDVYAVHLDDDTQAQMVELLSRQNDGYDEDDDEDACMDDDFRNRENSKLLQGNDVNILSNEPVITFSEDTFISYSEDIRHSPNDDVDLLGNIKIVHDVKGVDDANIVITPHFTLPGIEEEEHSDHPLAAAKETAVDERVDIDSPMDDSPSELESLSTTGNMDKRKIDQNESIHLHDDGLGSEIDEGSDIIDEQHQQKHQQSSVGEISFEEKSA